MRLKRKLNNRKIKSEFEYEVFKKVEAILPKGATVEYEAESFEYIIKHTYTPDLVITFKDGTKMYIEVKGNGRQFDQNVRQKMVAVKQQHPDKDIKIVFYADGKIGGLKKRKRGGYYKQSEWASRNKFDFSIKDPKEEWFNT
jgi:Phage endonuclease I